MGSMRGMKAFGRYGSLGFELLASIAVGYYLGRWADRKLGTHWLSFAGFLVGCYAGFRALFRAAKHMQRDIERDEALERGEDPWETTDGAADSEPPASPRATDESPRRDEER